MSHIKDATIRICLYHMSRMLLYVFVCVTYQGYYFTYLFVSNVKDATIRIWDTILGQTLQTLSSHLLSVTCVRWSGTNLLYSSSQDRTVKVWRADDVSFNLNFHCSTLVVVIPRAGVEELM